MLASRFARSNPAITNSLRRSSWWSQVKMGPEDPILGITVAFQKDTDPSKINLGVGAYRDDAGKPYVLKCVKEAEKKIHSSNIDMEYTAIGGSPAFNKAAANLLFSGDASSVVNNKLNASVQTLSGTGALRVAADFLNRFMPGATVYMPDPTWANHHPIVTDAGLKKANYRYYDAKTCGLDFKGMTEDLSNAPSGSVILLHACAHNPTGVDPTPEQWKELSKLCKEKNHFIFFDSAYQGFASGDPERDVQAIHTFLKDGHKPLICQSFAKNFGLYGHRVGGLHFIAKDSNEAEILLSQLKILIRPMYSNPPIHGARIVSTVMEDAELSKLWRKEVSEMAGRIHGMRQMLVDNLKSLGSKRDWSHVTNQIGMFCYSGLKPEQVDQLAKEHHIYMTRNGRISMAGVTSANNRYLAEAIHAVTK